ncbi:MAG: hypothetical protein Q7T87_15370 [Polaromonas sp.]|nr:hypothetical protein [Polaromonas sp.]
MRLAAACLACALSAGPLAAATADGWSGSYRLEWVAGVSQPPARVVLAKAPDADPDRLVEKYQADLARWTIADAGAPGETRLLRRFIGSEYTEWGWSGLHASGDIECLDASRLFVCRTTPGTTVRFGPDGPSQESLLARSGVFGIALHAGAFELNKE